jgi:pyruvate,water dikinase
MTLDDALILPLADIRAADLPLVGGKGANLGELTHVGLPVPPGFCLTTTAFRLFVQACPEIDDLYAMLDTVVADDVETAREVGQRVRSALEEVPVPAEIAVAVGQAWRALGQQYAYAVRSSATAEDLPDASFAGQQDTYLNITGEAELVNAVRRCWISLFTDRAILYRVRNGFAHEDVQLSVVVQQMVKAEVSGILFTADPLTGHRHTLAIDASFGLGEALVGGLVEPDAYRVDKQARTVLERRIADKGTAIVPEEAGGVSHVQLGEEQRSKPVLTDTKILELADMACHVEEHYGAPQDIEWAIASDRIYILQARPITTLYPIDGLSSPDDSLRIYFSVGHQQMMTNAMSPLGMSCMRTIIPIDRAEGEIESGFLRPSGGRLFGDVTPALRNPILRRIVLAVLSQFDALAPDAILSVLKREEFREAASISISLPALVGAGRMVSRIWSALLWQDLSDGYRTADAIIAEYVSDVRSRLDRAQPGEEQVLASVEAIQSMYRAVTWAPQFAASAGAHRLLRRLGRGWADPSDLEAYSLGMPGNVVTEMTLAVGDLADIARRSPGLTQLLGRLGNDGNAWLAEAARIEDSSEFLAAWREFVDRYGARGTTEIDIMTPRYCEEPLPLLRVLASSMDKPAGSHRAQHENLRRARENAVESLISGAHRGVLGWLRARLVRRLIHVSQQGGVLREHHKFLAVQTFRAVKEKVVETAEFLSDTGRLDQPDDVWYLAFPELLAVCRGDAQVGALQIPVRRDDLVRFGKLTPPRVITSDGETPVVQYHVSNAPPGALIGSPVSGGVVEGHVRVIRDPQTETLNAGEILVAPFTDPGWTPLFINASGLILEIGGAMTHGSVVAREYGIPAVVGVRDATRRLHSGQLVRVDGNTGVIEVL